MRGAHNVRRVRRRPLVTNPTRPQDPPSLVHARGTTMIAPFFMWLYLLVSVVLLINLLIAMFSNSYSAISLNSVRRL